MTKRYYCEGCDWIGDTSPIRESIGQDVYIEWCPQCRQHLVVEVKQHQKITVEDK